MYFHLNPKHFMLQNFPLTAKIMHHVIHRTEFSP